MKKLLICAAAAALLVLAPSAASAEIIEGTWEFEAYAGMYSPSPENDGIELDDDLTYGVRLGYNLSERFNIAGEIGYYQNDNDFTLDSDPMVTGNIDAEFIWVEGSAVWQIRPKARWVTTAYTGLGWAGWSVDANATNTVVTAWINDVEDDTLTVHIGFGGKLDLTEKMYLRLAGRARWFESRDDDEVDNEFTLGLGWKLGQ